MNNIRCKESQDRVIIRNGRCVGGECGTIKTRRGPEGVVTDGKQVIYCLGLKPEEVKFGVEVRLINISEVSERKIEWYG